MSASIIIPYRNESLLAGTVRGIRRTVNSEVEIIVVDDGSDRRIKYGDADKRLTMPEPVGLCYCRDAGIRAASNDTVILLDSHMFFLDNGWCEALTKYIGKNPTHVVCEASIRCNEDNHDPAWHLARMRYEAGATFVASQTQRTGRREILARRWNKRRYPGIYEVPCLLGGIYALSKDYYLNELKGVWQYHRGWGHSEQLVSMAAHYRGGKVMAHVKTPVGHLYRTGKQYSVPYSMYLWKVLHNQLLLMRLYASEEWMREKWGWLWDKYPVECDFAAHKFSAKQEADALREHFNSDENWQWFSEAYLGGE